MGFRTAAERSSEPGYKVTWRGERRKAKRGRFGGSTDMMTITISLPPETEEALRAQAAATGKEIDAFIVEAVEARLSLGQTSLRSILAPVHDDFRQSGMSDAELDALLKGALDESRAGRTDRGPAA